MYRAEQAHLQMVRIREDAGDLYMQDSRWDTCEDHERAFAYRIISQILGQEYAVIGAEYDQKYETLFYNVRVRPKVDALSVFHGPQKVGFAFIPADYCTVSRSGFWEAR